MYLVSVSWVFTTSLGVPFISSVTCLFSLFFYAPFISFCLKKKIGPLVENLCPRDWTQTLLPSPGRTKSKEKQKKPRRTKSERLWVKKTQNQVWTLFELILTAKCFPYDCEMVTMLYSLSKEPASVSDSAGLRCTLHQSGSWLRFGCNMMRLRATTVGCSTSSLPGEAMSQDFLQEISLAKSVYLLD